VIKFSYLSVFICVVINEPNGVVVVVHLYLFLLFLCFSAHAVYCYVTLKYLLVERP
jgi:hypothetical protein